MAAFFATSFGVDGAAQAKVSWAQGEGDAGAKISVAPRPDGFRLIGDRAGTNWISVDGKSDFYFSKVPSAGINANRAAIVETLENLEQPASMQAKLIKLEIEPASFISRKAHTQELSQNALISWPVLFLSAFLGLCLWASDRRRKIR